MAHDTNLASGLRTAGLQMISETEVDGQEAGH